MKVQQKSWKWIAMWVAVLCMGSLLVVACAVLLMTYVKRTITADQSAKATIAALATENLNLATQLTSPATPATTALPAPTTPSVMPTSTPQPTAASTNTSQPTPKPTSTPQPTAASTDTPQPTPKPTSRPTSVPDELPQGLSFTASPDPVKRGGTVTLSWDAPGATSVGITRLSPEGDIFIETEAFNLPPSGSIVLQVPEDYTESVKYYLGAHDANGVLHRSYVTVSIICRYDNHIAPRCPLTQDYVWAAYEPFETGRMVWRSDTREIYVLYADGNYETFEDTWLEGDPAVDLGTPPPGLHAPVRGFGDLYAHEPRVRQGLGWATAPEAGYTMGVETIRGGSGRYPATSVYFTLPDNHVVNLYPFTSTWELIQ